MKNILTLVAISMMIMPLVAISMMIALGATALVVLVLSPLVNVPGIPVFLFLTGYYTLCGILGVVKRKR